MDTPRHAHNETGNIVVALMNGACSRLAPLLNGLTSKAQQLCQSAKKVELTSEEVRFLYAAGFAALSYFVYSSMARQNDEEVSYHF